jgi:hypothetical protein
MTQAVTELLDGVAGVPRVFLTDVPEDEPLVPSTVLTNLGEVPAFHVKCMTPSNVAGLFKVEVYGTEAKGVEAVALLVMAAFRDAVLTIGPDPEVRAYRERYAVEGTTLRDEQGRQVFRATLTYSVRFNFDR